ncbi:MAG: hypothetical protein JST80_00815 [Bdellovibrionales bacterium]|nr:hypothetical protein [Bdellovibrionales bacterium]
MRRPLFFSASTLVLLSSAVPAKAWDQHQLLMQSIGRTTANLNRRYLYEKIAVPSEADEKAMIHTLATGLELREAAIPVYSQKHPDQKQIEVYELFRSDMIDEPDMGMDRDLPESADPNGVRKWMGGATGPTSQGFRHMIFPGFDYKQPLQTFQYPFHSVGEAPVRYQRLLIMSDKFFQEGQKFWGVRTLLWALHYLQDLHQPFHVLQVPYWKYLPLSDIFNHFIARCTHTLGNYHFAYEGIALTYLKHYDDMYMRDCFETNTQKISENLSEIIDKSRDEARNMSGPLYELFGESLKSPGIDLPKGVGVPDYYEVIKSSREEAVPKLREVTCRLFQNMAQYTWGMFDRAFTYTPEASTKRGR